MLVNTGPDKQNTGNMKNLEKTQDIWKLQIKLQKKLLCDVNEVTFEV